MRLPQIGDAATWQHGDEYGMGLSGKTGNVLHVHRIGGVNSRNSKTGGILQVFKKCRAE